MKNLMALVLSLVCVLSLVGCNKETTDVKPDTWPKEQSVLNLASYSDFEGVFVNVEGINNYPEIKSLVVSWNNNTEHEVTYGDEYWIERLENGEWVDCSLKTNIFTLIGYSLNANDTDNKEYRLTDMYDISKPGTYRFCATCTVDISEENFSECSVWAEFIIE